MLHRNLCLHAKIQENTLFNEYIHFSFVLINYITNLDMIFQ
jgi:hypothetical protein